MARSSDDEDDDDLDDDERHGKKPKKQMSRKDVESMLAMPAIFLQILALFSSLLGVIAIIVIATIFFLNFRLYQQNNVLALVVGEITHRILLTLVLIFYNLALASKANGLKKITDYDSAVAVCAMGALPGLGPCLFLGVPFGIWGFVVLMRDDVRAVFFDFKK